MEHKKTATSSVLSAVSTAVLIILLAHFFGSTLWPIEHRYLIDAAIVLLVAATACTLLIERYAQRNLFSIIGMVLPILGALPLGVLLLLLLTPRVGPFGGPAETRTAVPFVGTYALSMAAAAACLYLDRRPKRWYKTLTLFAALSAAYAIWLIFRLIKPT